MRLALSIGLLLGALLLTIPHTATADSAVEFPGTVVKVDADAHKIAVKKDQSGTRFTFVVTDKTQYTGVAGLKELKTGDHVTVSYAVQGSQYLAQKIVKK